VTAGSGVLDVGRGELAGVDLVGVWDPGGTSSSRSVVSFVSSSFTVSIVVSIRGHSTVTIKVRQGKFICRAQFVHKAIQSTLYILCLQREGLLHKFQHIFFTREWLTLQASSLILCCAHKWTRPFMC